MPDCWAKHEKTKMTLCKSFFVLEGESVNVEVSRAFESILKMRFYKKCRCHFNTIVFTSKYVSSYENKTRELPNKNLCFRFVYISKHHSLNVLEIIHS